MNVQDLEQMVRLFIGLGKETERESCYCIVAPSLEQCNKERLSILMKSGHVAAESFGKCSYLAVQVS